MNDRSPISGFRSATTPAETQPSAADPQTRKSPVQEGVELVQAMTIAGLPCTLEPHSGAEYRTALRRLHQLMQRFALDSIYEQYEDMWLSDKAVSERLSFGEWVCHKDHENEPFAKAYWAATSSYFRRVFQAAAAAA
jgi:hypothetical protein